MAYYRQIIERDLFKTQHAADSGADDVPPGPPDPVGPDLEVSLLGTASRSNGSGYAVIKHSGDSRQYLYKSGDVLKPMVLNKIRRNEVLLLDTNGETKSLGIEGNK